MAGVDRLEPAFDHQRVAAVGHRAAQRGDALRPEFVHECVGELLADLQRALLAMHVGGRSAHEGRELADYPADEPCRFGLVTPIRSRNPFVVELEHWASLARDVATARDVWTAIRFVLPPPGWRPDNQGETTEELRRRSLVAVRTDA